MDVVLHTPAVFKRPDSLCPAKRQVQHVGTEHLFAEDATKTCAGSRSLNLFESAKACLKSIQKQQRKDAKFYGAMYQNKEGYIFTWEDGRPYSPDYVTKTFKKAMKAFGRPEITLHKLRHSCCSMLIEKGWNIKQL